MQVCTEHRWRATIALKGTGRQIYGESDWGLWTDGRTDDIHISTVQTSLSTERPFIAIELAHCGWKATRKKYIQVQVGLNLNI